MRTLEFFAKGKREYFVAGTFLIDDDPTPLDVDAVKKRVEEIYAAKPWVNSDHPHIPQTVATKAVRIPRSGKQGLFEAMFGDSASISVKISLTDRLRQSQLRSFERFIAEMCGELNRAYNFRLISAGVQTWKSVAPFAN